MISSIGWPVPRVGLAVSDEVKDVRPRRLERGFQLLVRRSLEHLHLDHATKRSEGVFDFLDFVVGMPIVGWETDHEQHAQLGQTNGSRWRSAAMSPRNGGLRIGEDGADVVARQLPRASFRGFGSRILYRAQRSRHQQLPLLADGVRRQVRVQVTADLGDHG